MREKQAEVVPPAKCAFDPNDMTGSLAKCGYDSTQKHMPIPIFQVLESSYLAGSNRAADDAFAMLRAAMSKNKDIISL